MAVGYVRVVAETKRSVGAWYQIQHKGGRLRRYTIGEHVELYVVPQFPQIGPLARPGAPKPETTHNYFPSYTLHCTVVGAPRSESR